VLPQGKVDDGLRRLAERLILHCIYLADDGYFPRFAAKMQMLADGIPARPHLIRKGAVHHRYHGALRIIVVVEVAAA